MKKTLCICLVTALLVLLCTPAVFADDNLWFVAGTAEAEAGESVSIEIRVPQNPGVSGCLIGITYDPAVLLLDSVTPGSDDFPGAFFTSGSAIIPYNITWTADTSLHTSFIGTGLFATLNFTVLDDAPVGATEVALSYQQNSTFDVDFNDVICTMVNGSITVTEQPVPGGWSFSTDSTLRLWHGDPNTYVTGIDPDLAEVTGYLDLTGGWSYDVLANSTDNESTGAVLRIMDADDNVVESYEIVYYGDVNGDGEITPADAVETISVANYRSGYVWENFAEAQEYAFAMATDVNHDGEITMADAAEIIAAANHIESFNQLWMQDGDPAILY